jgi:hypothetical protein
MLTVGATGVLEEPPPELLPPHPANVSRNGNIISVANSERTEWNDRLARAFIACLLPRESD